MDRMLASASFRTSKRLSGFLRHIVGQTLDHDGADLKERMIGVQLFGRAPDYDTSTEPVVRVSAGDLRKRIAQYYHEPGHEHELRIDLPVGTYRPVFAWPANSPPPVAAEPAAAPDASPAISIANEVPAAPVPARSAWQSQRIVLSGATLLAVALGLFVFFEAPWKPVNAYAQFWEPVVASDGVALIYAGNRRDQDHLEFEDALAVAHISENLHEQKKPYEIVKDPAAAASRITKGPTVIVGTSADPIVQRATRDLRYTFAENSGPDGTTVSYIEDRQFPDNKSWSATTQSSPGDPVTTEYALVSRVMDPTTDNVAIVSAGLGPEANLGAAEFLSHPEQLQQVANQAPRDWRKRNMQAVLEIHVHHGRDKRTDKARLVASYFW